MTPAELAQVEAAKSDAQELWDIYNATGGSVFVLTKEGKKYDIGDIAITLKRRVIELEAEVARLKEWQAKAVPWLTDAKEFTDFSISKCPQITQMADDRQKKMIAELPALIAQAQEGDKA